MEKELSQLREQIDIIDNSVLDLLNKRMGVVKKVGDLKNKNSAPIYRPEREDAIINRLTKLSKDSNGLLSREAIEAVFLEIFAVSRNIELPEKVAYLGPEGTFTHQAAETRFGAMSEYLPMSTISSVFKTVESKRARFGVVPIENSTDGVVGETLDMLGRTNLKIVAELLMPIHHSLATVCGSLKDIKRIYSKDIAFGQCRNFLSDYNLENAERILTESTAKAAKKALEDDAGAAICSNIAAKLYRVPILYQNIEDSSQNKTRFIIISDSINMPSGKDKTSIFANIKNSEKSGSLFNFLKDFYDVGINLTKIESRPVSDVGDFSFWFFIDFEGHYQDENVQKVLNNHKAEIKWVGSYLKGDLSKLN